MDKKEAIKILRELHDKVLFSERTALETLHPELKESEDEKIRKELIVYVKDQQSSFISAPDCRDKYEEEENNKYKSWIAWLEKQGEKIDIANKEYWRGYREGKQEILDKYAELEKQGQKPQGKSALEAAKEENVDNQNCVKPADKVEPKFKVGDWIIYDRHISKVKDMDSEGYLVEDTYGDEGVPPKEFTEKHYRLWTIQDAKDGDVLASNRSIFIFSQEYIAGKPEAYCGIMNGLFLVKPEGCWTNEKYYPATKEQRDTLMKAMADAGYTFDFEKKELKKIEQKPWSEEDELTRKALINLVEMYYGGCIDKTEKNRLLNFLKSLRPQNTWKPSDAQMSALKIAANGCADQTVSQILSTLYKDLKKLTE